MKEEKIKVLALLPMELPKEIELDNTLEAMQNFVGGLIECITFKESPTLESRASTYARFFGIARCRSQRSTPSSDTVRFKGRKERFSS